MLTLRDGDYTVMLGWSGAERHLYPEAALPTVARQRLNTSQAPFRRKARAIQFPTTLLTRSNIIHPVS